MVYTVTLNPAVDRILFIDEFFRARTNRIKKTVETLGGKGTHVSINLKLLGVQSTALGITLGENGRKITRMMESWGVEVRFLHYEIPGMESRVNCELVEEKGHYCSMLTERGPILPVSITDALTEQMRRLIKPGDMLVLTGDASNVEDTAIYTKLTLCAKELGAKTFLDASGEYLVKGLRSQPFLIKPNLEELCYLTGKEIKTEEEIIAALRGMDGLGIAIVAMTWSGSGAVVKSGADIYRVYPVKVNVVNEVGCGDAFLSAVVAGLIRGESMEDLLKGATAVAGAAAESEITAGFDAARAKELRKQAKVKKL
ncbi:MAG: 1-phosphofructokinase family hexose kinase [Bacillota bacterium]|nr:1-phosphofructokinase family hexose kinase [Bacillota bacterium]